MNIRENSARGASLTEYTLLIACVAFVALIGARAFGQALVGGECQQGALTKITNSVNGVPHQIPCTQNGADPGR